MKKNTKNPRSSCNHNSLNNKLELDYLIADHTIQRTVMYNSLSVDHYITGV